MGKNKCEKLYEILGVSPDVNSKELKRAFRMRALSVHPDKCPGDENAVENFQHLQHAYEVLSDPERRKMYDLHGDVDEETISFNRAYEAFRTLFAQVTVEDIEEFALKYKHSDMEKADVEEFLIKHKGHVQDLLDWIPLSEWDEVDRFENLSKEILAGSLKGNSNIYKNFEKSLPKLKRKAKKNEVKFRKEAEELKKSEKKVDNSQDLVALITANRNKRSVAAANFFEKIEKSAAKKSKKNGPPPSEEEFMRIQKGLNKKTK